MTSKHALKFTCRPRQNAAIHWRSMYQRGRDVLTPGQSLNSYGKHKRSFNSHTAHGNSFFNISSKKKPYIQKMGMYLLFCISKISVWPHVLSLAMNRECSSPAATCAGLNSLGKGFEGLLLEFEGQIQIPTSSASVSYLFWNGRNKATTHAS